MNGSSRRIAQLQRELASNPASRQFYQLGELLRRDGRSEEAAEALRAGLAHHPRYVAAWVALGRACLDAGQVKDAAQGLEQALALDSQNPVAWRLLGEAHLGLGDRTAALDAMRHSLELVPGDEVLQAAVDALSSELAAATPAEAHALEPLPPAPPAAAPEPVPAPLAGFPVAAGAAEDLFGEPPVSVAAPETAAFPPEELPPALEASAPLVEPPPAVLAEGIPPAMADAPVEPEALEGFFAELALPLPSPDAAAPLPEAPPPAVEAPEPPPAEVVEAAVEVERDQFPEELFLAPPEPPEPVPLEEEPAPAAAEADLFQAPETEEAPVLLRQVLQATAEKAAVDVVAQPPASLTLARLYVQQQALPEAVGVLERLLEREPHNLEARDLLALLRDMMEPLPEAPPALPPRERKIAALQRWLASLTLGRERVAR